LLWQRMVIDVCSRCSMDLSRYGQGSVARVAQTDRNEQDEQIARERKAVMCQEREHARARARVREDRERERERERERFRGVCSYMSTW
jgi:hypothetical protein